MTDLSTLGGRRNVLDLYEDKVSLERLPRIDKATLVQVSVMAWGLSILFLGNNAERGKH